MAAERQPPPTSSGPTQGEREAVDAVFRALDRARADMDYEMRADERGRVVRVSGGVSWLTGLPGVGLEELVRFDTGALGLVLDLGESAGVVLLDPETHVESGVRARRTDRCRW